jgi:hypothetical protein
VTKDTEFDTLPEPGGIFNFTAVIYNPSTVDTATISNIDDTFGTPVCEDDNFALVTLPYDLGPSESILCAFSVVHTGNAHDFWINQVSVSATDDDGADVSAVSNEVTVSLTGVDPVIVIEKVGPASINEGGDSATYDITITNDSVSTDPLAEAEVDWVTAGNTAPIYLLPGESFTFDIVRPLEFNVGETHTNVVTVIGVDDEGTSATDNDDHTVVFDGVDPVILPRLRSLSRWRSSISQ